MKDIDLDKLRVNRSGTGAAPARRTHRLRPWYWLAGAAILALGYRLLPSVVEVQTTQVVSAWPSQQYQLLNATGYVVAQRKAAVSSKGTGRIEWLGVNEGDHVAAGTVLARLESHDVEASARAAVANTAVAAAALPSTQNELEDAQRNLERTTILFNKKLVSLLNMQDAQSRMARAKANRTSALASLDAARANEELARSNVEYTKIKAPFDGVVISRSANVGDIVTPVSSATDAGAVLVMADMSSLEVDADVSESALSSIKIGQPCEIVLDAFPDKRFRGEVGIVVPTVHRASATVTTKVRILDPDPNILPDMSARVAFLSQAVDAAQQQSVAAASPDAIVQRDGKAEVYVVGTDGRAHATAVTAGALLGGVRAVVGELKVGDTLVLNPGRKVRDGTAVKLAGAR